MNWQLCVCFSAALAALAMTTPLRAQSPEPSTTNFLNPGVGDWDFGDNWDLDFDGNPDGCVPGCFGFSAEVAGISNGGTAVINHPTPAPDDLIRGVVLGQTGQYPPDSPAQEGTLVLDGTGLLLRATDAVRVGDQGKGTLNILGGGLLSGSLSVSGSTQSALNLSGNASISTGDASLLRTTRIRGPNVNFEVAGDLTVDGTFVSEITGPTHSTIDAGNSTATIGGQLQVVLDGHNPGMGDTFTLIDALDVVGEFNRVDVAGAPLGTGLGYNVLYNSGGSGDVVLSVTNVLTLVVDRGTGEASIKNTFGSIDFDGYSIFSPAGSLDENGWMSLADAGLDGGNWQEVNRTKTHLNELNLLGMTSLSGGQSLNLGSPFDTAVGVEDLMFEFHIAGGLTVPGVVEYGDIISQQVGDTNADGRVDIDDLNSVRNNFGTVGPDDGTLDGDAFPFDGMVNIDDLNAVRNNFGSMIGAVPEPGGALLAGLAIVGLMGVRRRA